MLSSKLYLKTLTNKLLKDVRSYGASEKTINEYKVVCGGICSFGAERNEGFFSLELTDAYLELLDDRLGRKEICYEYCRFQKRVVRLLTSLAETGEADYSPTVPSIRKYPVLESVIGLIESILNENHIPLSSRKELFAPMRHLFWYADQQGCSWSSLNDVVIMQFLIDEVPLTNSGSTGRTLRCVKYITEYMKAHGIGYVKHNYAFLKLKNAPIRIIPAFSEEEISDLASAIDTNTPLGMRDYAIILLGYGTGLRGIDIINLKLEDIDWRHQKARIIQAKTHTPLIVELNGDVINALADYVLQARPDCKVKEVFVTSKAPYHGLKAGVGQMVDKYCHKAHIEKIPMRAFHSLRRSFETVLLSGGTPIDTVSRMMGHKKIDEDKPYITFDEGHTSLVAMDFSDVPIKSGVYADPSFQQMHAEMGGTV